MKKDTTKRAIGDVLDWSPRCREYFFPWRSKAADGQHGQSIAQAGITECHPGYRLERSAPRFHLLVYPMEGTGEVFTESAALRIHPGELLVAPAAKPFGYVPKSRTWRFMWFHLPDGDLWKSIRTRPLTIRRTMLTQPLRRITDEFLRESRGRSDSHRKATGLCAELIALYIARELGSAGGAEAEAGDRLNRLHALIDADLAREWSVSGMAEALGVSCSHLHRLTREHFKMSPMKFVTHLRIERAMEWLIMYDVPQRVIGEMVGYQNEFAFLVAFKRHLGVTPKEFRKRR